MHNFTEISEDRANGIFFRDRENAGVKFFADRRNFSRVKIQFFKVVLCNQDARGGGRDGLGKMFLLLCLLPGFADFLAALAYELSLALRFTEGDLEQESAGEGSRIALNLLTERKELFLAKLAEESLRKVDGIMGFISH